MVKNVKNPNGIYDVIIVGAGFAGITASRELSNHGFKTLILEGRDRIGGRTWTDNRLGKDIEMGGTWVHWTQPHVWTEIMRYGLELTTTPIENGYWFEGGKMKKGKARDFYGHIGKALTFFLEESRKHIPFPYKPLSSPTLEEVDKLSINDRLNQLNLPPDVFDNLKTFWEIAFSSTTEEAGYSTALHWMSLAMHDWVLLLETLGKFRLENGTKSLIESIASDSSADIQFSKKVSRIEKEGDMYKVYTAENERFIAKTVITTLPTNILNTIIFEPVLSELKQMAGAEGQTSRGMKYFARLRGQYESFAAYAPSGSLISLCQTYGEVDGDTIVVGFGPDASLLDPNDLPAIQNELRRWFPEVEVVECTGHNWVEDEFSGQTWNMPKRNQKIKYMAELQRPEQGVFLAGCDYASGWPGMMDGAIESGLVVSRKVQEYLKSESTKLIKQSK